MLSRVADALFWMSRYLERAEQTARLVDVCFHLELDLRSVSAGPPELQWTSLAAILKQSIPANGESIGSPQAQISHWLTFDTYNPNSILSCVARARMNARGIRGAINSEVWKAINKLYWQLSDATFTNQARESPHLFYEAVETGSHLVQGVCDATLTHDEGWQFLQLGKLLERIDKTLRILDIQYHLLQELADPADLPLTNLRWGGVLRSCAAYEAYQRLHLGRIEPHRVLAFLLQHPHFPRSVRFSLEMASRALTAIEGDNLERSPGRTDRLLGRVLSDLRYGDLDELLAHGQLHSFLASAQESCAQVSLTLQEQYSLR